MSLNIKEIIEATCTVQQWKISHCVTVIDFQPYDQKWLYTIKSFYIWRLEAKNIRTFSVDFGNIFK